MATIQLTCPAKVNVALSVGPPDADGLHPLASWMIALTFGDRLVVTQSDNDTTTFNITFADDAPQPGIVNWPLKKDLAFRAHKLVEEQVGRHLPVSVQLTKVIPTGAGLGGGSSDAAAVLIAINQLFDLGIDRDRLIAWGATLGSDVAFLVDALHGAPSAIVTGKGERIEPAPLARPIHLTLILPPLTCPTGAVYHALDVQRADQNVAHLPDTARVRRLVTGKLAPDSPFNDLAAPACHVQPQLAELLTKLTDTLRRPVHITGSGAAMFTIASDADEAARFAQQITESTGLPAVATQTC